MRTGTLYREYSKHPLATFGMLVLDNGKTWYTLELPWAQNTRNISCIPEGLYTLIPWVSPSRGRVLRVVRVIGRSNILIHSGNYLEDTRGCILIGKSIDHDGIRLRSSRNALSELLSELQDDTFSLDIVAAPNGGGPQGT